jgi:hypothetical protein
MALTEKFQLIIDTVGAGAAARDFDRLAASASGLGKATGKTAGMLDGLASKAGISASALKGGLATAAVAAGTALVGFAADSVGVFTDLAGAVLKVQRATGASAEDASLLVAAFDDMNISVETGSKGLFQLAKRVETSGEALAGFGVQVARAKDGTVDMAATLLSVADAYQATEDPGRRAALVNAAFGKSGQELIPILEAGRAGIERLFSGARDTGQILSEEQVKQAEDYRLAMDDLSDTVNEFSLTLGTTLVPQLARAADGLAGFIEKVGGLDSATADADDQTEGLLETLADFAVTALVGADGIEEEAAAAREATSVFSDMKGWVDRSRVSVAELDGELDTLMSTTLATTGAQRAYEQATRGVTNAERGLADARANLNELLREGAVDEEKVADARAALADATRSLGSATRSQAKAQREFDEAVVAAEALGGLDSALEEVADKHDRLLDANDAVTDATERQTEAAENLAEAQRGDPEFQDKLAAAKLRVADADTQVKDAQYAAAAQAYQLNQATDAQNGLLAGNADAIARVRDEWGQLLKLRPELEAFLGPALGGLTVPLTSVGPHGAPGAGTTSSTTNNNQQITVVAPVAADPIHIARQMMWELQ